MSDVLYSDAQQAQRKLFYGLCNVSLGSLALSVQFSPLMGYSIKWVLIFAWVLLFISTVVGGYRLGKETASLRHMYNIITNPNDNSGIEKLNILITENDKCIFYLTRVQIWSLIIGLLANLIFVSANYINKS